MNSSNSPLNFPFSTDNNKLNRMPNYGEINTGTTNGALQSLFRSSRFVPFPNGVDSNGNVTGKQPDIHNDENYNISVTDLIDYSAAKQLKSMRLTAADFAYLKDVGVFPNNRLMIARRFPAPVGNDLTAVKVSPLATIISWVPNDNDFIDITFGENWIDAEASFQDILNKIGGDTKLSADQGTKLGDMLSKGAGVIPLPGLMEGLQRDIMVSLGIVDGDPNKIILPSGNPNLIKQAKRRATVDKNTAGSGLMCKFDIKMRVEYEQKYINGIDSTLAYFDLLANILSFATSDAQFMYNNAFAQGSTGVLANLISGDVNAVSAALVDFVKKFTSVLVAKATEISDAIFNPKNTTKASTSSIKPTNAVIQTLVADTLGAVIGKYKIAILGVISALTGAASTPWHITIGNPKRPYFSSGDMLMENVHMTMGPVLAFNDLPSSIVIDFTLTNARPIGAQEIFNRFNTGKGRSYVRNMPEIASSNSSITNDGTLNTTNSNSVIETPFGTAVKSDWWNAAGDNPDAVDNTWDKNGNLNPPPPTTQPSTTFQSAGTTTTSTTTTTTTTNTTSPTGSIAPTSNNTSPTVVSTIKYTYTVQVQGPRQRVVAVDNSGNTVYTGQWSFSATSAILIQEAKLSLNDF